MNEENKDPKKIENLIMQGLAICPNPRLRTRLIRLKKELLQENQPVSKSDNRKYGNIPAIFGEYFFNDLLSLQETKLQFDLFIPT